MNIDDNRVEIFFWVLISIIQLIRNIVSTYLIVIVFWQCNEFLNHLCFFLNHLSTLSWFYHNFNLSIIKQWRVNNYLTRHFWHQFILFGVLGSTLCFIFRFYLTFVDFYFFVCINWIRIHWSWHMSLGVIEKCLGAISRLDIWMFLLYRLWEGHGEDADRVLILVQVNWFLNLNLFQVYQPRFPLLIVDLCFCFYWINVHWYWYL